MAFEKIIQLKNCRYDYTLSPSVKKFTLKDNTFFETKVGNYELTRLLEKVPNSGEGFNSKSSLTRNLQGLKSISLTSLAFV
ncbi:cytosolic protein [Streptococcus pneumoniae]|nr:cytosolic protein [Streptococcus pneumoniae]